MSMSEKIRLDTLVYEQGLAPSREMAQRYILAGEISVNGVVQNKPGMRVSSEAVLSLRQAAAFVGRGGLKLESALQQFQIDATGCICADVGASTGGFTDCLLQHGAAKVYAIDVGYGQLAVKLRNDPRVVVMERINARFLEKLDEPVSLVVMDVSFISIRLLFPVIRHWFAAQGDLITLIKPQFEAGKADVGKGGIVKNPAVHRQVLHDVLTDAQKTGYGVCGLIRSPVVGAKGNVEFLAWLSIGNASASTDSVPIQTMIDSLFSGPDA